MVAGYLIGVVVTASGLIEKRNPRTLEVTLRDRMPPSLYRANQPRVPLVLEHGGRRIGVACHLARNAIDGMLVVAELGEPLPRGVWYLSPGGKIPWFNSPTGPCRVAGTATMHHVAVVDFPGYVDIPPVVWSTKLYRPPAGICPSWLDVWERARRRIEADQN